MSRQTRLLTVKEFADAYRVTERTVYQWMRDGAVTVLRIAPRRGVRIVADDEVIFLSGCADNTSSTN